MRRRLHGAILLLYPRQVRRDHGGEMLALLDDLIAHEGRSPVRLSTRLAIDGLLQRATAAATAWTIVAVLVTTSLGGLVASDLAAARAQPASTGTARRVTTAAQTHRGTPSARPAGPRDRRRQVLAAAKTISAGTTP